MDLHVSRLARPLQGEQSVLEFHVLEVNTFSLPTRHILTLGQDLLASLSDAQGTPLASLFVVQGPPLFVLI